MPPKRGRGRGHPQGGDRQAGPRQQQPVHQPAPQAPRPEAGHHIPPSAWGQKPAPSPGREEVVRETRAPPRPAPQPKPEEILEQVAALSLQPASRQKYAMAKRPGFGKHGHPIKLFVNYFMLNFKDINIYHYDIDIKFDKSRRKDDDGGKGDSAQGPKKSRAKTSLMKEGMTAKEAAEKKISHVEHQQKRAPGKQRCREIIHKMIQVQELRKYSPSYDGQKNIYTIRPLPIKEKTTYTVTLDEDGKYKDFEVIVQPVEKKGGGNNIISLEPLRAVAAGRSTDLPQEIIMALDTVMCQRFPPFNQVQVGRSFFMLSGKRDNLGEGVEIWYGYSQSVRMTQRGPAVIVNFSAKAFHKSGPVIDYANDLLNTDVRKMNAMEPRDIKCLSDALSKVKVEVTHLRYPRKYPVKAVTFKPAKEIKFDNDGKQMTVAQYFQQHHNIALKFPYLPCLHMRANNNTTFIPMELCKVVPNQPKLGKLSGQMTAQMIRKTAIPPAVRFKEIENKVQGELYDASKESMNAFGLNMEIQPMRLQGRVLDAPRLQYSSASGQNVPAVVDSQGKWRMDAQFYKPPKEQTTWVLLNFTRTNEGALDNLAHTLVQSARKVGMNLEKAKAIRSFRPNDGVYNSLKLAKDWNVSFAVVVLSEFNKNQTYEEVKYDADMRLGLVTQCIKDKVVFKFNPQVATNVLLKINAKLGGVNHKLLQQPVIFQRPVIVFGADAIHSPRGFSCPSIAAVVGSLDAFPSQYAVTCRVQKNPDETKFSQEIILDLKDMVKSILEEFKRRTRGKYPEKVIFFRDGVSEGQFSTVLENEIEMVQQACNESLGGNVPPLTFIVVQKRHQTRFRPQNPREGVGKMGNVPPGTTVDTDITHPVNFDFFICSHEGIQGTSKPAHYTVLFDENKFAADDLQQLCYHLCHMYARCNRSISIPPPVMYADLACTRAKKYAELFISRDNRSVASSGSGEVELSPEVKNAINNNMAHFNGGMYYV